MGVFSVSGAKGVQREHRTQRTHQRGCVLCVRREGGGKGRAKHEKHTHVGVLSVFDARAEK